MICSISTDDPFVFLASLFFPLPYTGIFLQDKSLPLASSFTQNISLTGS